MKWHQPLAGTGAISVQGETAHALWKGGEWRESVRIGFAAQHSGHCTVQEGHNLTAGAGGVRAEGGCRHTVSDFILHSPGYALAALQRHLYEEKNHQLFVKQKELLELFLTKRAISRQQYEKSLHDLMEKTGYQD